MAKLRLLSLAVFGLAFALGIAGCAQGTQEGESGALSLDLTIADDVEIDEVAWTITGGDMPPMEGTIDTSAPGATASIEVFGLPPTIGQDYTITMAAIATDGETTCRGSEDFGIDVGQLTEIMVMLNCKRPTRLGGVRVNGKFNICAELAKVVVSPLQTSVGNDIDLSAQAVDVEGDEVTIVWSATGGSIDDSNANETTYTCGEIGQQSITVTVSDDDFEHCMDSWAVPVTCVAGDGGDLCEDVDCDDENECTNDECDPASGECVNDSVDDGTSCADGEGVCESGECVPADLCEDVDCDDQNECTTDLCNPDDGQCSNEPVDDGTSCNGDAGMCVDGDCMDVDLCAEVTCEDTGNECTTAECNPSTGLCETSDVADGTVCVGGPAELAVNGGFETGNLDGWTQFCDGPNNGTCAATTAQANGGLYSGNLVASVPQEGGAPSFPLIKNANIGVGTVQPNSPVAISFDLFGSLAGAGGVVFAELFSELEGGGTSKSEILGAGPVFPTDTWTTYTFLTTTGPDVSGGITLQLKVDCGASAGCTVDAYFDNVSVTVESDGGICEAGVCEPVDLCEGVVCEGTGNECTAAACNPDNGQCETSNVADGTPCDDGAGKCSAGICEVGAPEYEQDFEALNPADPDALSNDGWLYFGNVFDGNGAFKFGFGPFAAPTTSGQISGIAAGEGGPDQGAQQLVVFSNYDCCQPDEGHFNGTDLVETIVFQEINPIPAGFIGQLFEFTFDAKRGNIGGATTAQAFIRTLDPGAGFATTNNIVFDTTNLPTDWGTYAISLDLSDPLLQGQILQFGFSTIAKDFEPAGNFYDNNVATLSPLP